MVASRKPVVKVVIKRAAKISGVRREFVIERFERTRISVQKGFANVLMLEILLVETNFPLEMPKFNASSRDKLASDFASVRAGLFHVLLSSTKLVIPSAEPSSSEIKSRANSIGFAFSGIGRPNSEQNRGKLLGGPL